MNSLDKRILLALLSSHQSMYSLEKSLEGTNYASVFRHVKKMQKEGLLSASKTTRKNGKHDERGTEKPTLTAKGLATLIIDGDLQKADLVNVMEKELAKNYGDLPATFLFETQVDEIFVETLMKIRHKINLKFFDEVYFNKMFHISFIESLFEKMKKIDFKKNTPMKAKAPELSKKYISHSQIEALKKLREEFCEEKDRYSGYATVIERFLKAMENLAK
jgi:hypothetical protein